MWSSSLAVMEHPQGVVGAPPATSSSCPHTFQAASSSLWCPVPTSPSPPAFPALMGTPCPSNLFPSLPAALTALLFPGEAPASLLSSLFFVVVNFDAPKSSKTKATPVPRAVPSAQREGGTLPRGVTRAPVLFLGSAPAPGDLCQVISLLCAGASSCAARGSPGGMIPLAPAARGAPGGGADVPQPLPDFGRGGGKATSFCWDCYPSSSSFFNAFSFQGWSGTEEPRWNIARERKSM